MAERKSARKGFLLIPLAGITALLLIYLNRGVKPAAADEDELSRETPSTVWGGPGIEVTTTGSGADLTFDCATGTIEQPIQLDGFGNFDARGSYLEERDALGNLVEQLHPARYQGSIRGDGLSMVVWLPDSGRLIGAYAATRGIRASIHRCV